ncbi:MAG: hypothetical protein WKF97_20860 [Chitinophagaceae bacterium]
MNNAKSIVTNNNQDNKSKKQSIQEKLEKALSDLKPFMGKKRFKRRIRKAGKMIANGLSKKDLNNYQKQMQPAFNSAIVMEDAKISDLP